jgi:hypothetical protein
MLPRKWQVVMPPHEGEGALQEAGHVASIEDVVVLRIGPVHGFGECAILAIHGPAVAHPQLGDGLLVEQAAQCRRIDLGHP